MPLVNFIQKKENNPNSKLTATKTNGFLNTNESVKKQQVFELKEALHNALDIIEGKKPRKTLKDILNG